MERSFRCPTIAGVILVTLVPCAAGAQEFVATPSQRAQLAPGARVRVGSLPAQWHTPWPDQSGDQPLVESQGKWTGTLSLVS